MAATAATPKVWQKAKASAATPGARINPDGAGASWVRFLSPSFVRNDGNDYGTLGFGIDLIFGGVEP